MDGIAALAGVSDKDVVSRLDVLEKENQELRNSMYLAKKLGNTHISNTCISLDHLNDNINKMFINN